MDASEALGLLSALNSAVEGLDRCFTSPRVLLRPNIGTLHFITIPGRSSLWGVVKRYPDQPEPFYALFEVEGDSEPNIVQEAHYTATRRLEAHYLAFAAPVLAALAHSEGVRTAPDCDGVGRPTHGVAANPAKPVRRPTVEAALPSSTIAAPNFRTRIRGCGSAGSQRLRGPGRSHRQQARRVVLSCRSRSYRRGVFPRRRPCL